MKGETIQDLMDKINCFESRLYNLQIILKKMEEKVKCSKAFDKKTVKYLNEVNLELEQLKREILILIE